MSALGVDKDKKKYDIKHTIGSAMGEIFIADRSCPAFEPFKCRAENRCISIQAGLPCYSAGLGSQINGLFVCSVPLRWCGRLPGRLRRGRQAVHCGQAPPRGGDR